MTEEQLLDKIVGGFLTHKSSGMETSSRTGGDVSVFVCGRGLGTLRCSSVRRRS
jgi:hypothetical protein